MKKVTAEIVGGRIYTKSAWYPDASKDAKSVPGYSWRKTEKVWSYPLDFQTCIALRRTYGNSLSIGPKLWAWAAKERKRRDYLSEAGRQSDADLFQVSLISPTMAGAMEGRTYQRSGARFGAIANAVCFADQPSLGKTAMSLATLMEAEVWSGHRRHLVIAPKTSLASVWERQIRLWTDADVIAVPEGREPREEALERFLAASSDTIFLCVNPAMLRIKMNDWCAKCEVWSEKSKDKQWRWPDMHYWEGHKTKKEIQDQPWPKLFDITWDSVILDECHEVLSTYRPNRVTQTAEGLFKLRTREGAPKIAMTGTPIRGAEIKLWGIKSWLGHASGGYWAWIDNFFEKDDNGFGVTIGGLREDRKEDFYRELDSYVLRRTKREVKPELPEKDIQPVWVTMSPEQEKQYSAFAAAGEVAIEGGEIEGMGVLSELTRLKQLAYGSWAGSGANMKPTGDSPKLEWLIQALADRGVTGKVGDDFTPEEGIGHKYVIASQWKEVVDDVVKHLQGKKIPCLKITGSVTGKKRDEAIKSFNSPDGPRVLAITTKAGGASIELDAYCDEMFILDETWIADDQEQLEGRIDNRSGRVANRTFHYIRMEGTIEEDIAKGNITQDEMQKMLLDRRRGVEVATRLLRKS